MNAFASMKCGQARPLSGAEFPCPGPVTAFTIASICCVPESRAPLSTGPRRRGRRGWQDPRRSLDRGGSEWRVADARAQDIDRSPLES